jgi:hypothetical protein
MKKMILCGLMLLMSTSSFASHLLGGMVTVAQTSQDSTSIGVYLLVDPQGISGPNTIYVEKWEMNSQGWYVQNGTIALDKYNTNTHQGFNVVNYGSDYLDLDSNKYRFIYKNCCWGGLSNSSNSFSSEFVISADYWHIPNNSLPFAENPLWVNVQRDTLNTMKPMWGIYNCFLSQFDTDSVNITQSDLYSGYANGTFVPQTHTQIPLYVSNDSISWTPTTLGNFGTGFEIAEYRNGDKIGIQRIQWTFRVLSSTIGIEENVSNLNTSYEVYDWTGKYIGKDVNWEELNGLYIIKHSNGTIEKIYNI